MEVFVATSGGHGLMELPGGDLQRILPTRQEFGSYAREQDSYQVFEVPDEAAAQTRIDEVLDQILLTSLILDALDSKLSQTLRSETIELVNRHIVEQRDIALAFAVLYAAPLPSTSDPNGSLVLCDLLRCDALKQALEDLVEHQEAIVVVGEAWDQIPDDLFDDASHRPVIRAALARSGMFTRLVRTVQSDRPVDAFIFEALKPGPPTGASNWREMLTAWTAEFEHASTRVHTRAEESRREAELATRPLSRSEVFHRVTRQRDAIKAAMRDGDDARARQYLEDLVDFQTRRGDNVYLSKSLCDLSTTAKEIGNTPLQLELASRAVRVSPGDEWARVQLADALLANDRLADALTAYEQAAEAGGDVIAYTGRGQVLRLMNRFEDALRAYDEALDAGGNELIARLGIAETYRAMGRFDDALAEFERIGTDFPWSAMPIRCKFETLRSAFRLEEALEAAEAVPEESRDRYHWNSVAATLRSLGRTGEALGIYERQTEANPHDTIAVVGKAQALVEFGRLQEAESLLRAESGRAPWSFVVCHSLGNLLAHQLRYVDALDVYQSYLSLRGEHIEAEFERARVLRRMGRVDEALAEFQRLTSQGYESPSLFGERGQALRALGRTRDGLRVFDEGVERFPYDMDLRILRAELLVVLGQLAEAEEDLALVTEEHPYSVKAAVAMARLEWRSGRRHEAESSLGAIRERVPWDVLPTLTLATFWKSSGRAREALVLFDEVRKRQPMNRPALRGWIASLVLLEEYDEAFQGLQRTGPDDLFALHLKGIVTLASSEDSGDAVHDLSQARIRAQGEDVDSFTRAAFALALLRDGRYAEVKAVLTAAPLPSELEGIGKLLILHAVGEEGDAAAVERAYSDVGGAYLTESGAALAEELRERYISRSGIWRPDKSVFELELQCLAEAA